MAYIGKQPVVGNFQKCDAISVVNGQAAYTLNVGGAAVTPENANHMLVSLNGVLQAPGDSFTVSGSTLTFASNLATGDVIDFVIILGDVLDLGAPSDNTVATASIQANAVTAAKFNTDVISGQTALAETPADTDEFLVSDGGTIKRIDYSHIKGGGEKTLLATTTVSSGVSEVVFNNTYFTSTYRDYVISASQLDVDTDSARIYMQISINNASSYKSDSNYKYGVYGYESTGGNIGQNGTGGTQFEITSTPTSEADARTTSFRMYLIHPLSTSTYFSWYNLGFSHTTADRSNTFHGAGYYNSSAGDAVNAIRIYASSGNIDQGVFKIYGIT